MDGTVPFSTPGSPTAEAGSPVVARVVDHSTAGPVLDLGSARVVARRATSCLVEPATGDTVLAVAAGGDTYVLAILERPADSPARLSVPGAGPVTMAQPDLTLRCETLTVDAATATLRSKVARAAGQALHAVAERLDVVARTLRRTADVELSHAKTSSRTVDGTDTVVAGELMQEARSALAQRAGLVVIDAREDVRINGERITMG